MALKTRGVVRELVELVTALDRRVPQIHRPHEASIAQDAAALKLSALNRIHQLEHDSAAELLECSAMPSQQSGVTQGDEQPLCDHPHQECPRQG